MFKKALALILSVLLLQVNLSAAPGPTSPWTLAELVNKPYLELLEIAPGTRFSSQEIESFKKQLEQQEDSEKKRLESAEKLYKKQMDQARKELELLNKRASRDSNEMLTQRRDLHCNIERLEREILQTNTQRKQGVPVAHDNKIAKLELIQNWPAKKKEIEQLIATERARERRFGDVDDIGLRKVGEGQEKDLKTGLEAVREMKALGYMPPESEDKELTEYVQGLAETIARNSDLKIPVKVTILESDEINAFALPGGFLFVNTGLIRKAESESELVGVMAHEIGHVAARHGPRLMKRANIANIIYQAAQLAAVLATGGVAGIGMAYALEYGFMGLGMALNLTLLGVSRDFEMEADQLGVQYAWKAGYAPMGFITFFDKMASEKGYVKAASFFRTHPAFYERIFGTVSEIEYLPAQAELKVDSTEFHTMKDRLVEAEKETTQEKRRRPTLRRGGECQENLAPLPAPLTD